MNSGNLFAEVLRNFDRIMQYGDNWNHHGLFIKRQNLSEKMYTKRTDKYGRNHYKNNLNDS